MDYKNQLMWRYATKRMTGQKISNDKLHSILHAIRYSPTSMGLQPFKVIVVENPELKQKMQAVCMGQPQAVESSAMIVFTAWTEISQEKIDAYMANICKTRGVTPESLAGFKGNLERLLAAKNTEERFAWFARQAYIALGFGLFAAAMEQVDSTPMEGFDSSAMDALLGLSEKGLKSIALLAIGVRNEETDYLVKAKKVRREESDFFIWL